MKLNKNHIIISSCLVLLTFILSLILTYSSNTLSENSKISFWINVLLAIFGSSVVMLFTSLWGYFSERKKYELQYAAFARDFLLKSMRFLAVYDDKQSSSMDIYVNAGNIHSVYDVFAFEKNYEIYGYIFRYGKKFQKMHLIQNHIDNYAQEISRIETLARVDIEKGKTKSYFKTSINVTSINSDMQNIQALFSTKKKG